MKKFFLLRTSPIYSALSFSSNKKNRECERLSFCLHIASDNSRNNYYLSREQGCIITLHRERKQQLMMNLPRISKGPAIVLGMTTSVTLYAIFYSHFQQVRDKAVMRAGVERDKERLRLKRQQQQGDAQGGGESSR